MSYYIGTMFDGTFEQAVEAVTGELKKEGFGVLTDIDVKETLKKKIDVEFRKYRILGACSPHFAHKALQSEDKIGILLPCNVIVQETADGKVEVAAVDPIVAMQSVSNPALEGLATDVRGKLHKVIDALKGYSQAGR